MPFVPDSASKAGRFVPDGEKAPEDRSFVADLARNGLPWAAEGVNTILGAVPDLVAPDGAASAFFKSGAEYWRGKQSDDMQARVKASGQRIDAAGRDGVMAQAGAAVGEYVDDPALAARLAITNLPSFIPGLAAGKAVQGLGAVSRMSPAAQAALGLGVAGGTNAVLNAGGARGDAFEEIKKAAMARGMSEADATELALQGSIAPAAVGAATGYLSGKMGLEKALLGKVGAGQAAKRAAGAFGAEMAGEQLEEVLPKVASNLAVQSLDEKRGLTDDLGRTIVDTAVGAGPTSVASAGATGYRAMKGEGEAPAAAPGAAPAGATAADELLGTVETPNAAAPVSTQAPAQAGATTAAAPDQGATEAEKALMTPRTLTTLDRVDEIDRTLPTAPEADREALQVERAALTKDWPKAVPGVETTFSTEAGARVAARYSLMDAGELQTSHDVNLRPNPLYPTELQPRERDRAASAQQISGIVQKLDPARLGLSADAANGAPIVGADGLVESGNARTIALKRVYEANGLKADEYKGWLRENAAQFGLTPEAVDGMANPVLVRVRTTPVNRAEFARQANASTVAAMSTSEQAKSDANRIDVLEDLEPDDNGDFATSRDFIRRFMARLPQTEQSGMIDATGRLSASGYARVRNAVLAKAYGDSPVLARMTESMDDNMRNVSKALMIAAPRVAQARGAIKDGARFDADITPHLVDAVEQLSRLKESGTSVNDALAQAGIFGETYTPETAALLQFLAENARKPRKMAEFVTAYFDALDAAGDPRQAGIFGDTEAPSTTDLMGAARRTTEGATDGANPTPDAQRRDAGEAAPVGVGPGGQPADAQGRGRGDQGDGAARPAAANEAGGGQEWVNFGPETGTLGIPRANMPQVAIRLRPALLDYLQSRGINYVREDAPADSLKPTQAEYSRAKVDRSKSLAEDRTDASAVLVSSDGYVLDGHHRWLAKAEERQPVNTIKFDAPIDKLLDEVRGFSGTTTSNESATLLAQRTKAVENFYDAANDLAKIVSKRTRGPKGARAKQAGHLLMSMVPEDTPDLMPTLVKLFRSAIEVVGTDAKRATSWVKDRLKADSRFKPIWNKISNETYQKAALQALEAGPVDDMLGDTKPAPNMVVVDGVAHDANAPNFGFDPWPRTLDDNDPLLKDSREHTRGEWMGEDVSREAMRDAIVNEHFVGAVAPTGRKPIAYVMGGGGASGKGTIKKQLVQAGQISLDSVVDLDPDEIKGSIPEYRKIIEAGDNRAAAVVHEESSDLAKRVLARAIDGKFDMVYDVTLGNPEKGLATLKRLKDAGYEVRLFGVTVDPVSAVVRAEGRARKSGRYVPLSELLKAHKGFMAGFEQYATVVDEAHLFENTDGRRLLAETDLAGKLLPVKALEYNEAKERAGAINVEAQTLGEINGARAGAGSLAQGSPAGSDRVGPRGNGAGDRGGQADVRTGEGRGARGVDPGQDGTVAGRAEGRGRVDGGVANGTDQDGRARPEGSGAGTARGTGEGRKPAAVRGRSEQPDLFGVSDGNAGAAPAGEVGRPGVGGVRGQDADGAVTAPRGGARRPVAVPAGRDIGVKTGRNYRFTDDDLTYAGSWAKKAAANVDAVELLKKLQAEGRQATPDEQKALAKFIGWGSSEIANTIFGKKLDKDEEALRQYERAVEAFEKRGNRPMVPTRYTGYIEGYYDALAVLRNADPTIPSWGTPEVTREALDKAAPPPATRRWIDLRDRLKAALTPEEWAEASRSTQYAHYTSGPIVRSMWNTMRRFGFEGGAVLEPGAGVGIFPGLMPEAMAANSAYTGIEFDSITGGILKQLYPDERILLESFVDSKLPKNFYDVAAGNPPFSGTKILGDPEYQKLALSLHDYFFAKTIDRVRPGGLVMFVTSRYTMDKLDDKARAYLAERADLVGAIRLPQTAFKQNAGTDVVTDVLFLRKKVPGETFEQAQPWGKSVPMKVGSKTFQVNEYFHAHPEMVLGTPSDTGKMQNSPEPQYTVLAPESDIETLFAKASESLPANIYKPARGSDAEAAKVREIDVNPKAKKEGNYYITDAGALMQREGGVGTRVEGMKPADVEVVKALIPLRDALKQAHYDQLNGGEWETSLKALQAEYKAFVAKHGAVNQSVVKSVRVKVDELDENGDPTGRKVDDVEDRRSYPLLEKFRDDPDWTLVAALEKVNEETGEVSPGSFLTDRVLGKPKTPQIATPHDALLSTLNDVGRVDIPLIAQRLDMAPADVIEALGTAIYENPESGWETADQYLSGNVRRKLDNARAAAKADRKFERNVTALEAAQPAPKNPAQINAGIGMSWIPGEDYADFLKETAGVTAKIKFNEATRQWVVTELAGGSTAKATADWGVSSRWNATAIMEHALSGAPVRVTKTIGSGKDTKSVLDPAQTELAQQKLEAFREAFGTWLWKDADRSTRLVQIYNDRFNTHVARSFDGRHLTLPGASEQYNIFDHVKRGAWRIIQSGNTYLAHAVGSGKTFQMVISAMEQKRLGLVNKPMVVVPNHMLQQFAREWQDLYPAAKLMIADEQNFHTDNRRRFVSRVALSDLDGVIITHSAFKLLDLDPEYKAKIIEEQLAFLRASLEEAGGNEDDLRSAGGFGARKKTGSRDPKIKQIEKQIENMEQKLQASLSGVGKDKNVRFDELGVDFLYVDEAHAYRKLDFGTSRQVKGIQPAGSARALDLYIKARYLDDKNPGRSLVMASGTPITNTVAELYTVQRFMGRQVLKEKGIEDFDSWAAMFGRERTALEPNAAGKYEPVTRFNKFVNVPELTAMFRDFADVVTADQLAQMLGDKRPRVDGGSRGMVVTPKTQGYTKYQKVLEARVKTSKEWKPTKDEPNNPDPMIRIIGDGRLAAIDMRFVEPSAPSDPDSKLNKMIDDVIRTFKESADTVYNGKDGKPEAIKGSTMMVFSDLGFGAGVAANRGFNARAWFEKRLRDAGIPPAQVAFMSDYKKSTEKLKLFRDVNAGRVRLLVGSSANMGTGVNAQQRLLALFHLDSPWFPADLEQREGRIVRQGNKNPLVRLHAYAAKGTYDENMWKGLANKQYFIDLALSGDDSVREIEDLDSMSQFDMAAALVAEDPRILQLAGAQAEIAKMNRLYQAHEEQRQKFRTEFGWARDTVAWNEKRMPEAEKMAGQIPDLSGDNFRAKVGKGSFDKRSEWGEAIVARWKELSTAMQPTQTIGEIAGFPVRFVAVKTDSSYSATVQLATPEPIVLVDYGTESEVGIATRAVNATVEVARAPARMRENIAGARATMDALRPRLESPFPMAQLLADKVKEVAAIEAQLAAEGKPRPFRVERIDTGLGHEVQAVSEDAAIESAVATNGGTAADWRAYETKPGAEPAPDGVRLSRGAAGGIEYRALAGVAARVAQANPNFPRIHVLKSPAGAPQALRDYIDARGATADVEGAAFEGEIYLFASGIADEARAEHVLLEHEAAHIGLAAVLGPRKAATMRMIAAENAAVRRKAAEIQARDGLALVDAVEEVIVDMPSAALARLKGWRALVQKAVGGLKSLGFERIGQRLQAWLDGFTTDQQRADLFVADLVREARAFVAGRAAGRAAPALSRAAPAKSTTLFHTTKADNLASIARSGLVPGSAPRHAGVSSASRVSLAATEDAAAYYGGPRDVMLRTKPGFAASDLDVDALAGGEGTYTTGTAIPPAMLEARIGGRWMPLQEAADAVAAGARLDDIGSAGKFKVGQQVVTRSGAGKVKAVDAASGVVTVAIKGGMTMKFLGDDVRPVDARLSVATTPNQAPAGDAAQRAEAIIQNAARTPAPIDAATRLLTRVTGVEKAAALLYGQGAKLIDRLTPERLKAGIVSDYGVPEAVIDQRAMMQGRQRQALRGAGTLLEKLATLTRQESRVAYEWMTGEDTRTADELMKTLPEASVKVLQETRDLIDKMSQEAVRLGQLDAEAFKRNRFAYLRRSYFKHVAELKTGDKAKTARAISILGDQYKGRGMTDKAPMRQIQAAAPAWWQRKFVAGKADTSLKGEKLIRFERRAPIGERTATLEGMEEKTRPGKLLEVHYWPAGEPAPAKYADWDNAGTWEVRDTKGADLVLWRDFTKAERVKMGEIDEARFAIGKTLHAMIHDVEVGRYIEWLSKTHAKKPGEEIDGPVVDASERYRDAFKPGEWVQVPDTKIQGTSVLKYGALAGRYLPGPIWNDLRQVAGGGRIMPEWYQTMQGWWKTLKTALTPGVHTNNIMSNFVMADWHDVSAGHVAKALRILLGASQRDGKGLIGRTGNALSRVGTADAEAARAIISRYEDSGGAIGGWVTQEIQTGQLEPVLAALERELNSATAAAAGNAEVGVYSALQHALHLKFPEAWQSFKGSMPAKAVAQEGSNLIDLYQAEDDVFRLAAWLKAKEAGLSDAEAGKVSRRSFLDYSINAPWVQMMRQTALPFISFSYRAIPMLLETAGKKPHKIMKLMMIAGGLNALAGVLLGGGAGDDDEARKLLPEEKAGRIWGMVPKLIRMPWNDAHGSPVFLDIRRWVPVGDVADLGQGHAAIPIPPALMPGGPLAVLGEVFFNRSMFTGKDITLETDTATEKAKKIADHLWKAAAPNILGLPGTYATTGVVDAAKGRTDAFGREQSVAQAIASTMGVKVGSYPPDVLRRNLMAKAAAESAEIDKQVAQLKRQRQTNRISQEEFEAEFRAQREKQQKLKAKLAEKVN